LEEINKGINKDIVVKSSMFFYNDVEDILGRCLSNGWYCFII